jgi:hypothetical protein
MTKHASFKHQVRTHMAATGEKYTEARRHLLEQADQPLLRAAVPLFDDIGRHDSSPAGEGEDSFTFLDRAAGVVWERTRDVLSTWFATYPSEHAADLRGKFRSKHAGQHLAAWWELYLYRLFLRLGYSIEVHPSVPGSSKRPDFLLTKDTERFYLEAAVVFSGIVDEARNGVREGWIIDAANRGKSPNFYVGIDFDQVGTLRPKDRDIYEPVQAWLTTLDPDQVTADHEASGELPEKLIAVDDWRVRFTAMPIKAEARGDESRGRLVGMGPVTAGFIDDKEQIRDTVKHKSGRYGNPDIPVVLALNCVGSFPEDEDIAAALYGSIAVQYVPDAPGSSKTVRLRDGAWIDEQGPRGRRVSAVLSAVQLHSHTAVKVAPQLWHHPRAQVSLNVGWPFSEWRCSEQGLIASQRREVDMATLLGLPPEWPGPERPFERRRSRR